LKVLLLSAYAAGSHVSWQQHLRQMLPDWDWTVMELPPRHFSWRVRGNPLYWSQAQREQLEGEFDLLLATSMVDLATLRGLVPRLASIPSALYFHENQFDYPAGRGKHGFLEAQMVSLYAAIAADCLLFNSRYNLEGFINGCRQLLGRLPDKVPTGVAERLLKKAEVLPVPVDVETLASGASYWPGEGGGRPLRLLWVGRFEYDKGGDRLLAVLRQLEASPVDFEVALVGQRFRRSPAAFETLEAEFSHRLVHCGYVPELEDFHALLRGADLVLSTALHEFQGLAVMEAVAAGCLPVVPDRLAYPELYPPDCRYASMPDDPEAEAKAAVACLLEGWAGLQRHEAPVPDLRRFSLAAMTPRYRRALGVLARPTG
jgi:glycosyltransferase involved in cell wall biosynthesis